ncbi:MAG: MMPL family transporter, partial [Treponema sp.]|nr:MMPL family transporter [Treponema sp.]
MKFLRAFFKHPVIIIIVSVVLTGATGFFLKDLEMDNSTRMFFPQKDVSYVRLEDTEAEFGSMLAIGVSIEAQDGSILTPEYITVIREITDKVLELSNVEDVDSLTNIDFVCDQDGAISANPLIPDSYSGTAQDIMQLEGRLAEWSDMYNRVIINDEGTGTQMSISLRPKSDILIAYDEAKEALKTAKESNASAEELAAATKAFKDAKKAKKLAPPDSQRLQDTLYEVKKITGAACEGHNLTYKFYGDPVVSDNCKSFMLSDLLRLIPLVIVVVIITLYLSFHTLDGTILPLLTVLMSTIISCGLMGFFHFTFTLVASVIPVALIAVGSAYGIHVLTHYYIELSNVKGEMTKELYENAIFKGLQEVFVAVLLAGITTIVGFVSLITSPLEPLHSFAIFAAVGVAVALILSVTFIPALLLLKSYKNLKKRNRIEQLSDKVRQKLDRAQQMRGGKSVTEASGDTLYTIYRFFCGTRVRLIITSLVIVVMSITGLLKLRVDTSLISYFPRTSQLRTDIDYVNEEFAGTNSVYFNIIGQEKGDITNPELLKAVDDLEIYLKGKYPEVGKLISLTTFIKRINQVWHVPARSAGSGESALALDSGDFGDDGRDSSFGSDDSFGDDGWDSGFGSDDSFGDDGWDSGFGSDDSFGDDGWDSGFSSDDSFSDGDADSLAFDAGDSSAGRGVVSDWVDPNEAYAAALSKQVTGQEILDMFNKAYVAAGGRTASVETIVDELMKQMNYNGMAYYEVPYDPAKYPVASREELSGVVSGYLTLLSGSLDRFIDDDISPKQMRITCQLREHSTEVSGKIIADVKQYAATHFPAGYTVEATGTGEMEYTMTNMIISSQFMSLIVSLLSVVLIITLSFKSGWAGLLGAVQLAFAIMLNYMTMGFAKINLDFITSIIASVVVGVGIEYTIHFLTTYREERSRSRDLVEVTKNTFKKSGHGIVT